MTEPAELLTTIEFYCRARGMDTPMELDHEDAMVAMQAIAIASAAIRRRVGRTFAASDREFDLNGTGTNVITLPEPPVTSVTSVAVIDDSGNETEVDFDQYRLDPDDGILVRLGGRCWPRGFRNVLVDAVVGYRLPAAEDDSGTLDAPELPEDIQGVVASLAGRIADSGSTGSATSTTGGAIKAVTTPLGYHEEYETAAEAAGAVTSSGDEYGLTALEASIVDGYRLGRW